MLAELKLTGKLRPEAAYGVCSMFFLTITEPIALVDSIKLNLFKNACLSYRI